MSKVGPVVLGPNQSPRFYRGGARISAFRELPPPAPGDAYLPEDWVASTTAIFGTETESMSRLPDGTLLREAISANPEGYLGPGHTARYGASPALLVKLLDAGERLPVHVHPDDAFAATHLACAWGKTEAWIVVEAARGSEVRLGFREQVPAQQLAQWVWDQDPAMHEALNPLAVHPGDAILVPAGLPHSIGEGVFLVELQEPTDFSILLEWERFALDGRTDGHLGLGFDLALTCVDRSAWDASQIATLRGPAPCGPISGVFPPAADTFFAAERIRPARGTVAAPPGFAVLIVLAGHGLLCSEQADDQPLGKGMTVLVPHGAGGTRIAGDCEVIRCIPPYGSRSIFPA